MTPAFEGGTIEVVTRIVIGDLLPGACEPLSPISFYRSRLLSTPDARTTRPPYGTVLRRHRRASHRTPVTPAPLAPSFVGPSGLPHGPRLGLSGCEETAERGIKEAQMATTDMTVKIQANDKGNPVGKLADAELHFTAGPLEGLKLIGFGIWERRGGSGRNVTFPARQYAVNGERRSFALLRPIVDAAAQERIRELVLEAYAAYEQRASIASR